MTTENWENGPTLSLGEEEKKGLRDKAKALAGQVGKTYHELGGVLYRVYASEAYLDWGFASFNDWAEAEIGYSWRKCRYLMSIWHAVEFDYPHVRDRMEEIGWAKAAKIVGIATEADVEDWLEKAEEGTYRELDEEVKIAAGKRSKSETVTRKFTFGLTEEQAENVELALDLAAKELGKDSTAPMGNRLDLICADFVAGHSASDDKKGALLASLKALTGEEYGPVGAEAFMVALMRKALDEPEKVRESIGAVVRGPLTLKEFFIFLEANKIIKPTVVVEKASEGDYE